MDRRTRGQGTGDRGQRSVAAGEVVCCLECGVTYALVGDDRDLVLEDWRTAIAEDGRVLMLCPRCDQAERRQIDARRRRP